MELNPEQVVSAKLPIREIKAAIVDSLERGSYPYFEEVADEVGIAPRTLQRYLSAAGTPYRQLVYDARFALVTKLLRDPNVPIASVAKKAGYALPSGLSHAVRIRNGMTPSQYRSRLLRRKRRRKA